MSASDGFSPLYPVVVRAIAAGHWTHPAIKAVLKSHNVSGATIKQLLTRMHRELGLIHSRRGGWGVSDRGMRLLPRLVETPEVVPYRPPAAPPRRPGSDVSHLPSVAGGRLYWPGPRA